MDQQSIRRQQYNTVLLFLTNKCQMFSQKLEHVSNINIFSHNQPIDWRHCIGLYTLANGYPTNVKLKPPQLYYAIFFFLLCRTLCMFAFGTFQVFTISIMNYRHLFSTTMIRSGLAMSHFKITESYWNIKIEITFPHSKYSIQLSSIQK